MRKTLSITGTLLVAILLFLGACGPSSATTTITVTAPPATITAPPTTITITPTPTPTPAPTPTPTLTPTPTPTSTSVIYSINQNVKVGKARWKLLTAMDKGSVLKGTESRYPSFTEDKTTSGKFIEISLEVENIGTITETWWSEPNIIDKQIREFKPASEVYNWIPEEKWSAMKELQPNIPQQFIWIYEVPKDAVGLKVKVEDIATPSRGEALISLGL